MTVAQLPAMLEEMRTLTRLLIEVPLKWDKFAAEVSPEEIAKLLTEEERKECYDAICALEAALDNIMTTEDADGTQKLLTC